MDAMEFAETMYTTVDMRFGPPVSIVSDRDSRITSHFWKEVCEYDKVKRRLSTAFHPQTDGQTEALNKTLENYLRAYTSIEQMNWTKLLPAAAFAYNQRHQPIEFRRGQLIKLSTRNLRLKNKKLAPRWIGPFRITEVIGSQAYHLALPNQYSRLHDVFPVQLLEKYSARDDRETLPMPALGDELDEFEVEEVRAKETKNGVTRYLIKWTGWPSEYNQWVSEEDMNNSQAKIRSFEKGRKRKKAVEDG